MQVITLDGASIVDAAHIIPFSTSHNNDIRNGFALCKNHHWCFDMGLITVDRNYKIDISPLVDDSKFLADLSGETVLLPRIRKLYPSPDAFEWHQENIFQV
jgi:putative restriction endonuclease